MRRHVSLISGLFLCLLLFSSCGVVKVGTIPRGTPDTGNGTPAVLVTPAPDLSKVPQAPTSSTGSTYAFVRQNQVWLASGSIPAQVTSFDFTKLPNVFWHRPLWSPDDHSLAFIVNAQPTGVGGGGCGSPESGASGALYVMDTHSKQALILSVSTGASSTNTHGQPPTDQWQTFFWEDATHLLAWYNGSTGKTSALAGLYRYSLASHELKQVLPLSALGGVSLPSFSGADAPLLLSLRYSSGQLFYQVVVHPLEQQSQLVIYRHSVVHPEILSSQVVSQGHEPWCGATQVGAYSLPGWDVSSDGEQLVSQMILSGAPNQGVAAVEDIDLKDSSTTNLFTQLSPDLLAHDLSLTWAPDSQTVVASESHPVIQRGPFSASLANPGTMQQYSPSLSGSLAWRSDASAFALQRSIFAGDTGQPAIYLFLSGDSQGRLLLTDAQEFSWG